MTAGARRPVSVAELVATLALISDLGMGRPIERVLRQTVIAMRLAALAEADDEVRTATYYTSLLTWVGCAGGHERPRRAVRRRDRAVRRHPVGGHGRRDRGAVLVHAPRQGRRPGPAAVDGRPVPGERWSLGERRDDLALPSTGELAERLDLGADVQQPLLQAFERWDGHGVPGACEAEDLSLTIRLVHLADAVEMFHRTGGAAAAVEVVTARRGTQFDPSLVDLLVRPSRRRPRRARHDPGVGRGDRPGPTSRPRARRGRARPSRSRRSPTSPTSSRRCGPATRVAWPRSPPTPRPRSVSAPTRCGRSGGRRSSTTSA